MKILKIWSGVDSNFYPETKFRIYTDEDKLVEDHGSNREEQYYDVSPVSRVIINSMVERARKREAEKKAKAEHERDLAEYERLKNKLGL